MKKFVIFSLIAVVVAGMAFAQLADGITVNAWGRGVFAPLVVAGAPMDGDGNKLKDANGDDLEAKVYTGSNATWGGDDGAPRVDFRINGATDYAGFTVQTNSETGGVGSGDAGANLWVQPFGSAALKLQVGNHFMNDTLRGKVATDTGFENFVLNPINEDAIFNRFASGGKGPWENSTWLFETNSFFLSSAPMDGLFIGLMLSGTMWAPANGSYYEYNDDDEFEYATGITEAKDVFRFMHIGAGYEIEGIGHIRAQWIGGWMGTEKDATDKKYVAFTNWDGGGNTWNGGGGPARIEAAFALTAVENLLVDLGAKIWMPTTFNNKDKASCGIDIGLGATFNADAFGIAASVTLTDLGAYYKADDIDDKYKAGMSLGINLIPTYDLDFGTLGLSLGLKMTASDKFGSDSVDNDTMQLGFGGFFKKGLAGGSFKAGLAYMLAPLNHDKKAEGSGVFSIPIILEYAFF